MPDEPQVSDDDFDELSEAEQDRAFRKRFGMFSPSYDTDPVQDAIDSDEYHQILDGMDDEEFFNGGLTEIEKASEPLVAKAVHADFVLNTPHDPEGYGVEIDGSRDAIKLLLVAVTIETNRWKKPPKAEATAAGIGLAITHVRKDRHVKHPRDIAKEVGVRAQTLFAIRKLALEEIQRLNLAIELLDTSSQSMGTYNEG